jgi:hypothetical protein
VAGERRDRRDEEGVVRVGDHGEGGGRGVGRGCWGEVRVGMRVGVG